jgi:hypothetical protein
MIDRTQVKLVGIARSSAYYQPQPSARQSRN